MSENICKFIPGKPSSEPLCAVNFVYETEPQKTSGAAMRSSYQICTVTGGSAILKMQGKSFSLKKGCVFFTFPGVSYEILDTKELRFMYISFTGRAAQEHLNTAGVTRDCFVFSGFDYIIDFWWGAILMMNGKNDSMLAESVLLYTLSALSADPSDKADSSQREKNVASVKNYLDTHYHEFDMSLSKVCTIFTYNEKYLSTLFKKQMGVGFNAYLRGIRMKKACELFDRGLSGISEVAELCGYADQAYFSKQFKLFTGKTPTRYLSEKTQK